MTGTSRLRWATRGLRAQSAKQRASQAELRKNREALLERSGGACEAGQSPYCRGVGSEIHHLKKRSQGGSNDPRNLAWVCGPCNGWVEDNPDAAYRAGLVTKSWEEEDE